MVRRGSEGRTKREWCYVQQPAVFSIAPCACGNADLMWSEFEKHVWCERCQLDFIPAHGGIFDGPIPIRACALLGIRFDRFVIATGAIQRYDVGSGEYLAPEGAATSRKRGGSRAMADDLPRATMLQRAVTRRFVVDTQDTASFIRWRDAMTTCAPGRLGALRGPAKLWAYARCWWMVVTGVVPAAALRLEPKS